MKPAMYIFANKGLNMSPGKLAAQVAHAAVLAFELSPPKMKEVWLDTGYTKIVLEAEDTEQLQNIETYLKEKGFRDLAPIVDEGRTEVRPFSYTALGVPILNREHPPVATTFQEFRTFKTPKPPKRRRFSRTRIYSKS